MFKKYVVSILVITGSLLACIGIFNYKIDPGNIFNSDSSSAFYGNKMIEGNDIVVLRNYNERLWQKYVLTHEPEAKNILIFGSSRTMGIGEEFFPFESTRNYSVSGASLEDDIALFSLYVETHKKFPQKIILGLDAWLLNKNNGQERWKSIAVDYEKGLQMIGQKNEIQYLDTKKYQQLISMPYFKASLEKWRNQSRNEQVLQVFHEGMEVSDTAAIVKADGSRVWPDKWTNVSEDEVEKAAMKYIERNIYGLSRYEKFDRDLESAFVQFIEYLLRYDVEIVLYLTPYHPLVYRYLENHDMYKIICEEEDYFRDFSRRHGIKIVGSYNPELCGLSEHDFIDGMHVRRASMYRAFYGQF